MSCKLVQLNTYLFPVNAGVINLFFHEQSKSHKPYQTKKILKSSNNETETLEYFLPIIQKEREISSNPINLNNPIKPDLNGQPNKQISNKTKSNIPSVLGIELIKPIEPIISNLPNIR